MVFAFVFFSSLRFLLCPPPPFPPGQPHALARNLTSEASGALSSASASSRTSSETWERSRAAEAEAEAEAEEEEKVEVEEFAKVENPARALALPGVAATTASALLHLATSADGGKPPTNAATVGRGAGERESSEETTSAAWSATSLVGARMRTFGEEEDEDEEDDDDELAAVAASTAGTPKAAVFPVPDRARTSRSAPESASGMARA